MGQYVSSENYAAIKRLYGAKEAERLAKQYDWQVTLPEAELTPVGAPIAPASPTGGLGGGTTVADDKNKTALPVSGLSIAEAQQATAQKNADLANADVTNQIQSQLSILEDARNRLRDRRVGPSASEKWLAIAAALGQPTRTGSFGESLGNLTQALGAQKAARREAEEKRDLMLEKYGLDVGTERLRLKQAAATQADRTLRALIEANEPVRGVAVGDRLVNPYTNEEIQPPKGTKRSFQGRTYEFQGGDQYDQSNWKEVS
jgi:hypothetical protein